MRRPPLIRAPRAAALITALATAAPVARAQFDASDPADLTGVSVVTVGVGSARQRLDGGAPGPTTEARLLGAARLAYWVRPAWALDLSAARFGPLDDGAITPVLLGAAWYPRPSAAAPRVRPYLGASVGLFIRSFSPADDGTFGGRRAPARNDAVPGARLSAGVDAFVARRVVLGFLAGYHAAGRFEATEPRLGGTAARPAGPMFAVTAGVALPRREP